MVNLTLNTGERARRRAFPSTLIVGPLLALLVVVGCRPPLSGDVDIEAVVRNESTNEMEISVVTIETATDLWLGESSLFYFLRDVSVNKLNLLGVEDTETYPTLDDYVATQRESSGGRAPDIVMHEENGAWIADDYDTLFLLSAWVGLERSLLYFRSVGDDSGATNDPLLVAQYGKVHAFGVPEGGADNAAYLDRVDMMILDPVFFIGQLTASLPLALSDGVIAHELGHRLFFHRVFVDVAEDAFRREAAEDVERNLTNLLRGLNEGVADVMGVGMTRDPYFGRFVSLGNDRDLEGDLALSLTYERLSDGVDDEGCGDTEEDFGAVGFNPYCIATLFARTLYEGSGLDVDTFSDVMVPALVRALPRFGRNISEASNTNDAYTLSVEQLLEPLVDELPTLDDQTRLCTAYRARFSSVVNEGRIPSCP